MKRFIPATLLLTALPLLVAAASPNGPMTEVLDALASLGPKPIDTLTPDEARRQPTPSDAVKVVLQKRGDSTAPESVGKIENRSIQGPAGSIAVRIYWPLHRTEAKSRPSCITSTGAAG